MSRASGFMPKKIAGERLALNVHGRNQTISPCELAWAKAY